ncbi:alpha/beta fold hydrolase [Streptomyces sp. NPDC058691]|uniref:alpha/beta fold hydrolase n=1 Tax=Streptomyces sp. NPDC058691 TaxID=3346601 RepID=UPI003659B769
MDIDTDPIPRTPPRPRRIRTAAPLTAVLAAAALAAGPIAASTAAAAPGDGRTGGGGKPTVVLVHGAFADASSWDEVVRRLEGEGYDVIAPANPLRGLTNDSTYIASVLRSIKGPIVLAGHSYGGAVISEAAAGNPDVKALVYVSAFMPDRGETLAALGAKFPQTRLGDVQRMVPYRDATGSGVDVYIRDASFHSVFAADLPAARARLMAAEQRPIATTAFTQAATGAAWRTVPSWALVATEDHAINPALERYEAERAGSHTVEVGSSHVAMISHPDVVTRLIREAAASAASPAAATSGAPALADTGWRETIVTAIGGIAGAALIMGGVFLALARKSRG